MLLSPQMLEDREALQRLEGLVRRVDICHLDLPTRICKMLVGLGYHTIGEAIDAFENNPKLCPGFGPKSQAAFVRVMNDFGIIVIRPRPKETFL